jgi:two-component system nitrate/nitrite sensor histidine kinase NarX
MAQDLGQSPDLSHSGSFRQALADRETVPGRPQAYLASLLTVLDSIEACSTFDGIYRATLDSIQHITQFDAIILRRYDAVQNCFRLVVERGLSPAVRTRVHCITDDPVFANMLRQKRASFRPPIHAEAMAAGYQQVVFVPLISSNRVVGSIDLVSRSPAAPSDDDLHWLEVVGRCVALAIQHVQQAEQHRDSTVVQERARLAREIHDGPGQLLAALNLLAGELDDRLERHDLAAARQVSLRVQGLARDANDSLREEILALHDDPRVGEGLVAYLRNYVARFERQWGLECRLDVVGVPDEIDGQPLAPAVTTQVVRIVQEALANVRRHARARQVWVELHAGGPGLTVRVHDDGKGFDVERPAATGLGLRIMQERAVGVGGRIHLHSRVSGGTTLEFHLPRAAGPLCSLTP